MNEKTLDFIRLILNSELTRPTKEEIVRFFCLPRNTPIKPSIELDSEDEGVIAVERPSAEDIELENDPKRKEEEEDTRKLLKGA
jgi:hypothetical protein